MTLERRTIVVTALVAVVVGGVWFAAPGIASSTSPDGLVADAGANSPQEDARANISQEDARANSPQEAKLSQGYEVSLDNVTIRTWLLRNSTVRNATLQQVVVRNVTTADGGRTNVTLSNVTVGTFTLERARLTNVTATKLIVRNKSVLSVPGGEFVDPNVENRTIERHWTRNATVSGAVIERVSIDAAVLCENASLGDRANDSAAFDPRSGDEKPDIEVTNGTVEEALVMRGEASNWSVGSVDQSASTDASLPQACNRG